MCCSIIESLKIVSWKPEMKQNICMRLNPIEPNFLVATSAKGEDEEGPITKNKKRDDVAEQVQHANQ